MEGQEESSVTEEVSKHNLAVKSLGAIGGGFLTGFLAIPGSVVCFCYWIGMSIYNACKSYKDEVVKIWSEGSKGTAIFAAIFGPILMPFAFLGFALGFRSMENNAKYVFSKIISPGIWILEKTGVKTPASEEVASSQITDGEMRQCLFWESAEIPDDMAEFHVGKDIWRRFKELRASQQTARGKTPMSVVAQQPIEDKFFNS